MSAIKKITRLSDDIRRIFINAYGENEEMMRLCRDHSDPLILHDDKPVMDITQDEFVGIFNLNANHYFLSPGQASRFGIYCKLPLPNLIALMLKAEWEQFIFKMAQNISGSKSDPGPILVNQDLVSMYILDFKPDKGRMYKWIRNNSNSTFSGLSYSQVDFLMSDLLKRKVFLSGNEQISRLYPETEITEELFLSKIPKPKQDEYIRLKELWKMKSTKDELFSFSPSMLLYSYPDYRQLLSIYERACLILGIDPDCYDIGDRLEFMVRNGASIEAILDFLNTETVKIELHLARLEIVQDEYTNEDQTRLYSSALENINLHSDKLKADIAVLKIQIKEIKKRITGQIIKEDKQ